MVCGLWDLPGAHVPVGSARPIPTTPCPAIPALAPDLGTHNSARIWGQERLSKSQTDGCQQPPATWSKLLILPPPSSPVVWVRRVCVGMGGPREVLRGLQAAGPQSYGRAFVSFPSEKALSTLRYHLAIYTVLLYINCAAGEGMNHTCSTRAARAPAQPQPAPLQPAPSPGPRAALRRAPIWGHLRGCSQVRASCLGSVADACSRVSP